MKIKLPIHPLQSATLGTALILLFSGTCLALEPTITGKNPAPTALAANASKNIVSERNGVPVFENKLGCSLVPYHEGDAWGLGAFYLNGAKLGQTVTNFAVEESVGRSYKLSGYQIMENSPERGSVRFFGKDGKLDFSVTVSLNNDSCAY